MDKIVFLLEEPSMEILLEGMLPRMFPETQFQYISHEGKNDLEKSILPKLREIGENRACALSSSATTTAAIA